MVNIVRSFLGVGFKASVQKNERRSSIAFGMPAEEQLPAAG
jgi:hypothetical protein